MICERCADEIQHGVTLPPEMRGPIWVIAGQQRRATPMLRRIFKILWSRRDRLVSRDSFMVLLYGTRNDPPLDRTVDIHLWRLPSLLDGSGLGIDNVPGQGCQLVRTSLHATDWTRARAGARLRAARDTVGRRHTRGMAMALATAGPPLTSV